VLDDLAAPDRETSMTFTGEPDAAAAWSPAPP
jgi:hypothetical protein